MYWRVRKSSVDQIVRQYAVHGLLAFSAMLNVILMATRPSPNKDLPKDVKVNFDQFARTVTNHLLDTSYISYRDSTIALTQGGELAPNVMAALAKANMLATTNEDLTAQAKLLFDQRQVSAVKIDDVQIGEPNQNSLIPVDVRGVVAIHSAEESGNNEPVHFHFRYIIGNRANPKDHTPMVGADGKPLPMV
ncbi:MAG TPA: hypothetical protein V6C72_00710, partial [Chroococcales cyanobacterium]